MAKNDTLAVLFPEREVVLAGVTYVIRPFSFGQIPVVIDLVRSILVDLVTLPLDKISVSKDGIKMDKEDVAAFTTFICNHFDKLAYIIALAAGKEREEILALPYDVGIGLALQVLEMNKSFFFARVAPLLPQKETAAPLKSSKIVGAK